MDEDFAVDGVAAELEGAAGVVQYASGLRHRLIFNGWTTAGAESLVELLIAQSMGEATAMRLMGADDDEDDRV